MWHNTSKPNQVSRSECHLLVQLKTNLQQLMHRRVRRRCRFLLPLHRRRGALCSVL